MHHVIDSHVGTFSLYKSFSHIKMLEIVIAPQAREREEREKGRGERKRETHSASGGSIKMSTAGPVSFSCFFFLV